MRFLIFRLILALPILLQILAAARADSAGFRSLYEAVPRMENVSYRNLVQLIVPDLTEGYGMFEGHSIIDIRHIGGIENKPPETLRIFNVAELVLSSETQNRILLLVDLGDGDGTTEGFAVLALFNLDGRRPVLTDAVGIGYGRSTYFSAPALLSLGDGKNAVLTTSASFGSTDAHLSTVMMLLRDDRLDFIDTVSTVENRRCGIKRKQVPTFRAGDRSGRAYADIVATVTETVGPTGETCENAQPVAEATRDITVTYRWNGASRFVADSDAFEVLAKENATAF